MVTNGNISRNNYLYKLKELFNRDEAIKDMDAYFTRVALGTYHKPYWSKDCDKLLDLLEQKRLFVKALKERYAYYKSLDPEYREILYKNLHNGDSLETLAEKYDIHPRTLFRKIALINKALSHIN